MYRIREVDGVEMEHELHELHDACFGDTAPMPDFAVGTWYVVRYHGEVVGFLGWFRSTYYPTLAYFSRVGVLPLHRGNRLQQRLMRRMERDVKALGYSGMVSDTSDNTPSANNFIRMGWMIFDPEFKWSFAHTLYWRKDWLRDGSC